MIFLLLFNIISNIHIGIAYADGCVQNSNLENPLIFQLQSAT